MNGESYINDIFHSFDCYEGTLTFVVIQVGLPGKLSFSYAVLTQWYGLCPKLSRLNIASTLKNTIEVPTFEPWATYDVFGYD